MITTMWRREVFRRVGIPQTKRHAAQEAQSTTTNNKPAHGQSRPKLAAKTKSRSKKELNNLLPVRAKLLPFLALALALVVLSSLFYTKTIAAINQRRLAWHTSSSLRGKRSSALAVALASIVNGEPPVNHLPGDAQSRLSNEFIKAKDNHNKRIAEPSPKPQAEFESRLTRNSIGYSNTSTRENPIPLSIITEGCSGSSSLTDFLERILTAHGLSIMQDEFNGEIFYAAKNIYWDSAVQKLIQEGGIPDTFAEEKAQNPDKTKNKPYINKVILEAVNQTILSAAGNNQTLLFKSKPPSVLTSQNCSVAKSLKEMGVAFAYLYRSNILDQAVCEVRDCFNPGIGYPVLATNGTKTKLCMRRRKVSVKVKAHMNISRLVNFIHDRERKLLGNIEALREFTESGKAFANEELYAFEYTSDEDTFAKGLDAWTKFLSFAIDVDETILTDFMRRHQGTLQLKPHTEVIANINEVMTVLEEAGLSLYLRL
mmetsp:Transcript_5419/g.12327  ORF Transcript_5419/g.12327 Transcript_5419/m.12327 type:complete len:484 (+) Transcript_5419:42-1493(+)